jgi:hypothetical protein
MKRCRHPQHLIVVAMNVCFAEAIFRGSEIYGMRMVFVVQNRMQRVGKPLQQQSRQKYQY